MVARNYFEKKIPFSVETPKIQFFYKNPAYDFFNYVQNRHWVLYDLVFNTFPINIPFICCYIKIQFLNTFALVPKLLIIF